MKRVGLSFAGIGTIALLLVVSLSVLEGVKYRIREEQGLDPVLAPTWVVVLTYAGLWTCAFALVALVVTALVARRNAKRRAPEGAAFDH